MLHRRVMAVCSALATAGALALGAALPGTAVAATGVAPVADTSATDRATTDSSAPNVTEPAASSYAPKISSGQLRAMQRDFGLNAEQARQRLVQERTAGATAGRLRAQLGGDFAGAWLRAGQPAQGQERARLGEKAGLTVATTDRADAEAITARGARAEVVEHSLAELTAAKEALDAAAKRHAPAATPVWYVDVRSNKLVLLSSKPAEAERFAESAGVRTAHVTVRKSAVEPRTFAELRGGDPYVVGGESRCSIGFPVTKGRMSGFVSAGHCGDTGDTVTDPDGKSLGTFRGSNFPGDDHSYVGANSDWTASATVNGYDTKDQAIAGSTEAMVGASVCRSGSTTGWHCGSVEQLDTSVRYPQGTVTGVTRTDVCAEPGDSGGSFVSGDQAQGMTSGGSGNCTDGGTTYFQPVNEALDTYQVSLATTSAGERAPTNPDAEEGGWAASTVYEAGDVVSYDGVDYRCLQSHQAQPVGAPSDNSRLWQRIPEPGQ
ncbi:alpha-lytic protease prodomain-containing protein [Streptomyces oceani]|uniref:Chitin-binding type-3 domain-containing protein n=1 Tax=Streptomyces oceani TaxID=1075402 RepID=A0A1E7JVR9_9ACTN|nr:alpha-lytic protease prodomain-containing protein [Streptomyces oceani]OEU94806.1 hypothetical protein AN216_23910 [Streptomyces oceani]